MSLAREEAPLGASSLYQSLRRVLGLLEGHRAWLNALMVLSALSALLEIVPPLLVRAALDRYLLPPFVRLEAARARELGLNGVPDSRKEGFVLVERVGLSSAEREALEVQGALTDGAYRLPDGSFLQASDLARLKPAEQKRIRSEGRRGVIALALGFGGLLLLMFALTYGVTFGLNRLGQEAVFRIRVRLWDRLLHLPVRSFDENPVGRLVTRVANDPSTLAELFTSVLSTALSDIVAFVGILVALLCLNARLTLLLLAIAPLLVLLSLWFKRASRVVYRLLRVQLASLNTYLQESFSGLAVIRSFGFAPEARARFQEQNLDYYGTQVRLVHLYAIFRPAIDFLASAATALLVWYAGGQVLRHELSLGSLVAFLLYLRLLFRPLQELADKFNLLQSSLVSAERMLLLLDEPPEPSGPTHAPVQSSGAPAIEFEDVRFAYDPAKPVLQGITFRVAPGEKVALVGPTGGGKSTLLSLLLRFYPLGADSGRIRIGGQDIALWDTTALRRLFAFVPQDLFLFRGTLAENLSLGGQPHLLLKGPLHELLERLSRAGDRNGSFHFALSEGERQLVSLGRAMASGGPIVLLDEATASIDSATEAVIQAALKDALENRTALIVAHRLSTVQSADRILVLSKGRIAEEGSHTELLAQGGLYAHLYNAESRSGIGA